MPRLGDSDDTESGALSIDGPSLPRTREIPARAPARPESRFKSAVGPWPQALAGAGLAGPGPASPARDWGQPGPIRHGAEGGRMLAQLETISHVRKRTREGLETKRDREREERGRATDYERVCEKEKKKESEN